MIYMCLSLTPYIHTDSVELLDCDLSDQTPILSNVQVLDPPHNTQVSMHGIDDIHVYMHIILFIIN